MSETNDKGDPVAGTGEREAASGARRARRWTRWALELGVFVAVLLVIQWWQARDVPEGPAPAFTGATASGAETSLEKWRAAHPGRPVVVYFWADWCPICKAQEGSVDAVQRDWPVLTVAMQSGNAAAVANFLHRRGLAWPTVIDADGAIARRFGVRGVPTLVVVGPDGEMRSVMVGYTTEAGMRLRLWWAGAGG
jgi:thiol:disulfide interchange protein